jgi:hypothetical protein
LEAPTGFEPVVKLLQSHALPLGYGAELRYLIISNFSVFCNPYEKIIIKDIEIIPLFLMLELIKLVKIYL